MICHLVFEHEYTQYYNEFICRNFDIRDHVFIVYARSTIGYRTDFDFKNGQHLHLGEPGCLELLNAASAIIVHGLFFESVIDLLYNHRDFLDKAVWVLWGGDLYLYRHLGTEKLSEALENKRRAVISGIKWIACPVLEDHALAVSVYNSTARYICAYYSMTIDFDYLDTIRETRNSAGPVRILLGNSADPSNNHEEMLHALARFRDDVEIFCPLSYGSNEYSDRVTVLGRELFGDRFIPLTEPRPFNEYTAFLATIDLGVMNHDRQQGLGTIVILLYLGKKVFIRSDISSHATFTNNGVALFDVNELKECPLDSIVRYDSGTRLSNINAIRRDYSETGCCDRWTQLFKTVNSGVHMNDEQSARQLSEKLKSKDFPESRFTGPYESEGKTVSVWEEQWLWSNREFIRGTVLDMSTPRYWHEFIHQLDAVDRVLISNLDNEPVSKFGQSSMPDVVGDFCKPGIVPNCSFDTILCLSILEHCEDMFGMFKNLFDMLKPGGHVFFYTPYAYTDGHLTPDYWRIGRDGYRLLADRTGFEIVQERNAGDMGKYLMEDYGIDASATDWHRGIPNAVTVVCRRPELPAGKTFDKTGKSLPGTAMTRLYAGDIPDLPEYDGWTGLSIAKRDHRHLLHDITAPLPFADNSVDAFQAEDVIEHIPYDRLAPVIDEIYRVLKPGTLFRLSIPDYGCDVLRERSVKDACGNIVFDPGGGGTPEDPGHLWFPRIDSVYRLLEKSRFFSEGSINFLHYWNMTGLSFVADPIDYSKGMIKRTPDNDARVKSPYRPMSLVVDLYKGQTVQSGAPRKPAIPWRHDGGIFAYPHGWQTPAITEQYAYEQAFGVFPDSPHAAYIAFPWATLIDLLQTNQEEKAAVYLEILAAIPRIDAPCRITVAQHIYAGRYIHLFRDAGITDIFWTHATHDTTQIDGINIHPFPLFPVRCLDEPVLPVKPFAERAYLYSFIGAYDPNVYLTDSRLRLANLPTAPDGCIVVKSEWHFQSAVYESQIFGREIPVAKQAQSDRDASEYRRVLQESVFSLCPSGSGPNSIRIWESLGYGSIPVIIADTLRLPGDAGEWKEAAVFVAENPDTLAQLPGMLRELARDSRRLEQYRQAGERLWRKYGIGGFTHDLIAFAEQLCGVRAEKPDAVQPFHIGSTGSGRPAITIVTPSFNQGEYLERCIDSILSQNYPNLDYIIMDGGSSDNSVQVIKKHEKYLSHWQSRPDGGHYPALNEGFRQSRGDIMGWLNSDDMFHQGGLQVIADVFGSRSDVRFLTGKRIGFDGEGNRRSYGFETQTWSRDFLLNPETVQQHLFVMQEATYWRRDLWNEAGAGLDTSYKLAADYELWLRFLRHAQLHTVDALIAGFRMYGEGQRSKAFIDSYLAECVQAIDKERHLVSRHPNLDSVAPQLINFPPEPASSCVTLNDFKEFTFAKRHHFSAFKDNALDLYNSEIDPDDCDLKVYQDLLVFTFIRNNIPKGSKILDIGGGTSRILAYFSNDYECWNLDKLEGAGNGPLEVCNSGYRLVRDYIGNFNTELPEEYFDFVFSISSLEHVPCGERRHRELHKNICIDIDRVLKPGGISLHCFDITISTIRRCWTNELAPYMAECFSRQEHRGSLQEAANSPDLYTMSEQYFNTHWKKHPAVNWEFAGGKPSSWNVIWQKPLNPRLEGAAISWDAIQRYRTAIDPRLPKLTVVTPSFNQVEFLEECIQSVLGQHYPNLEYLVMDGGSNDGSEYIIQRYSHLLSYWQSQPDNGQYSAIHDGFLRSSGQIMTWINSDDRFHPGAFEKVAAIFSERPDIEWITCRPNSIDEQGNQLEVRADLPQWSREKYLRKQYKDPYIQQEGTFWRRTLWDKAGGGLRLDLKLAGDLELWARFFRHAKLHTTGDLLAAFRVHPDQKTASFLQQYWLEAESVLDREIELHSRSNGAGQQPAVGQNRYDFLVSAIVSTYKSEKFIQGCLDDLTAQTLFRSGRLEIVIVNSASPQDEERIIQPYFMKYPRQIKYIRTDERETIYKAWNRGIEASSGKYLTNANTDDRHRFDALEIMANELEANPEHVLVYTDQLYTTVPNDTFEATATTKLRVWAEYSYQTLRSHCMVSSQPMWRRSMHDLYGYFDDSYTSAGDWEFWLRIGKKEAFKKIRKVLGLYFENPEGVENSNPLSEPEAMKVRQTYGIAPHEQRYSAFAVYRRDRYSSGASEETPRVSVILPCYNYAQYLKHAVGSVLTQTYQDFEIIIINDGSTDNSREVAEQCVSLFPQYRIRVINQENSGHPAHSRNRGICDALGDYILPLDADDMIAPTMLEECVGLLDRRPDISIAYTDQIYFNEKEQGISNQPEYDLSQLIHKNQFGYCSLYRRKAWEDAGGYRVIGYEDWDFWITCGERGHHAMRIAKPLFYYRKKESGVYAEDLKRDRELRARIIMNHTALYPRQSVEEAKGILREIDGADSIATAEEQEGISFCIITGGKRPEMLELAIRSIRAQKIPAYEIIVIGKHHPAPGITYLPAEEAAGHGRLGAMRNLGVARARYSTIAIMDDDIILSTDWHREFARYGDSFDILTSQVRVPDGSRYWDHCTHGGPRGHVLLEGNESDDHLYMTGGGGWVMSSRVAKTIRWDDERGFYKEEDTTFSSLCRSRGFSIQHNHRMIVYHADGVYTGIGRWVARRSDGRTQEWVEPALANRTETDILNLANKFLEQQQYAEAADCVRMGLLMYRKSDLLTSAWREISGNWGGDLSDSRWYPQGDPAFLNTIALLKGTQLPDGPGTGTKQDFPAAALTVVPPAERLSIVWEGPQFMWHSMAHVNRELCLKLIEMGHHLSLIPVGTASFGPETVPQFTPLRVHEHKQLPGEPDVTIRHWYPPNFTPPAAGYWVMMQPWEMGSIPKQWIESMKDTVDELWVYTSYVRECYIRSGFPADRVFVAPIGIDTDLFTPAVSPMPLTTRKKWKFLYVGGTTLDRKGFDILINSYLREFTSNDDVTLVVKDLAIYTGGKNPIAQQLRELQSRPGAPEILVIEDDLTPDRLAGLYAACDCLVHSYRGEGFSLPIAEAMAMELPVIVTGHGACLDFCGADNAYLIPAREVTVPTKQVYGLETVDNPWWAEPDADEFRRLMRSAVNDPAAGKRKGKAGRARILAGFTWDHAARAMQARLQELRKRPIRRFAPQLQPTAAVIPADRSKNILMVAPILPTFDRDSGSFRLFQIITMLRQQGHHITFIARGGAGGVDPAPYQKALDDLGVKNYALDPDKLRQLGLAIDAPRVDLQRILGDRHYDLAYIYFHHIAYQYMDEIRSISPSTRIIVDSVDLHFLREQREAELTGSSKALLKAQQTKQIELAIYGKADMVIAVTEADKQELLVHAPNVSAEVIPNIHPLLPDAPPYDARRDILFVGGFPHTPNVDAVLYFCAEVWPLLKDRLPQARLFLVGNAPPDAVRALASERIIVTGYVPETLPYLQQCRVSIAPLRYGAGMKGKVGEALAAGIPVVATSVAAEGTGMVPGRDILVADDPGSFAEAVIFLYDQESEWNRLAGNGREFMTRNYSPEALAATLPRIISRAAGGSDHAFQSRSDCVVRPTSRQVRELLRPYGGTYFNESH